MNTLTIGNIINNAFRIGMKNIASILGAVILWLITIWIPYLNVGTTIALLGLVVAMSKGGIISPTEIFDAKYRRNMGEFFLLIAFMWIGVTAGYVFVVIPGIVISIAWGQALFLLIDKNLSPTEAMRMSNKLTYGHKWTIFLGQFLLAIILIVAIYVVVYILGIIAEFLGFLAGLIGYFVFMAIMLGAAAYIYGELTREPQTGSVEE
ncbi:MAG: hypothetical protein GF313_08775 [Caldithrix sp.]|nr:hypothetical protein [Caldithrix sp.]